MKYLKNREFLEKNVNKKEKGITLIALVVTIIVLLILASISIAMLTGENGLINQAKSAKEITGQAQIEEQVDIAVLEALTNGLGKIKSTNLLDNALKSNMGEVDYIVTGDLDKGWYVETEIETFKISSTGEIEIIQKVKDENPRIYGRKRNKRKSI